MPKGFSNISEHIVQTVSLSRYISQYVPLKKSGANFLGQCPFHSEKTPSFTVNEDKHFFYCFGCQESGNIFQFAIKYHRLSFKEALEQVASYAGISLDSQAYQKLSRREKFLKSFKDFLQEVALCFHKEGKIPNNSGLKYLKDRQISSASFTNFLLGFAPASSSFLSSKLSLSEYDEKLLVSSQLFLASSSSPHQDKFRYKLVFPIQNKNGEIIAFGFRTLQPGGLPKYINSSESPVFKKREVLYGLYQAKEAIKTQNSVYVTEGYFDVIALHEKGLKNTVATLGTSITPSHIETILSLAKEIIFVFDGDAAGKKAANKAIFLCLKRDIAPKIVLCKPEKDPYDMAQIYGEELPSWMKSHTQSWEEFFLQEIERESSPVEQKKLTQKYFAELSSISPFLIRSFEKQVNQYFLPQNPKRFSSQTTFRRRETHIPLPFLSPINRTRSMELSFLSLCLFSSNPKEELLEKMSIGESFFHSPEAREVFQLLSQSNVAPSLDSLLGKLPPQLREMLKEEYQKLLSIENYPKALSDSYHHLLITDLQIREKDLKSEIEKSPSTGENILSHLQELQVVTKRRKDLEYKLKNF